MIKLFAIEWARLIAYAQTSETFDPGVFQIMHDRYAKAWQKLDVAEQGYVCQLIHERT